MTTAAPNTQPLAQPFAHTGTLADVAGLALKNALLNIVTLTLYRFWARTSIRRRIWSRAWVLGDSLEYTGTGGELFRGFLIALPGYFLPAIFVFYIAPIAMDRTVASVLAVGFIILSNPLIAAARFWMRRYQLSRTRWRGIRLGLDGSAAGFAFASWGWSVLQGLSLGWYTPVARMRRAKLLWESARFGDQAFAFSEDKSPAAPLWWPFTLGWLGYIGAYFITAAIAVGALAAAGLGALFPGAGAPAPTAPSLAATVTAAAAFLAAIALYLAILGLFWAPYNAAAMNRIASLLSLDGARFRLKAKTFSLYFITLAGWIITIGSLGFLAPVAGMMQVRYIINRLELIGAPRFAEIGQSIVAAPQSGEGFADAFDLDMGVGII